MRSINASAFVSLTFAVALFLQCAVPVPALAQQSPYRRIQPAATGVARPEDLVRLPGSVWVVTSSMRGPDGEPGRLFLVNGAGGSQPRPLYPSHDSRNEPDHARFPSCSSAPDPSVFYPHGLTVTSLNDGGVELLVVNHGGREAIEFFRVTLRKATPHADWIGCVPLPGHDFGNGVAPLPTGGFVVTNMYDTTDADFLKEFAMAQPTGGVRQWTPQNGWSDAVSQRLSGANGVEVTPDGKWLYVSEWAARKLWVFSLKTNAAPRSIDVDFLPDNLRWTDHGTLLLAGQYTAPEKLFGCQARREPCPLGFSVVEVDPRTLGVHILVKGGDTTFGGATGALFVGKELWVGSFRGEAIGRFVPANDKPTR